MNKKHALCSLLLSCAVYATSAAADTKTDIAGKWESVACELRPQQGPDGSIGQWWLTRDISFTPGRVEAEFTTYADPGCQTPVNELHFAGQAEFTGASETIDGAYEAKLTINEFVRIKPLADDFTAFLNSAQPGTCGATAWKTNEAQDILASGCSVIGVKANEPTIEYEILAVIDDYLYFAARPVDGSFMTAPEKRVQALQIGLRRQ